MNDCGSGCPIGICGPSLALSIVIDCLMGALVWDCISRERLSRGQETDCLGLPKPLRSLQAQTDLFHQLNN